MQAIRGDAGAGESSGELVAEHHVGELRFAVRTEAAIVLLALQIIEIDRVVSLRHRRHVHDAHLPFHTRGAGAHGWRLAARARYVARRLIIVSSMRPTSFSNQTRTTAAS